MSLTLVVNGQNRSFEELAQPATLAQVIAAMNLKGDRVAVEHNGQIVQRAQWADTASPQATAWRSYTSSVVDD